MAELAFLPLATDAWVADTAHLSRAERGLYMDLLILMWRTPECRVPNDLTWIARKLMCGPGEADLLANIVAEFCRTTGNWLDQKRLRKEWDYVRERSVKRREAAKARWGKDKDASTSNALVHDGCNAPTPTPTPTPTLTKEKTTVPVVQKKSAEAKRGTRIDADFEMPVEWKRWAGADRSWTPQDVREERLKFIDYWAAKAGADGLKLDWQATWRNWCRNSRRGSSAAQPAFDTRPAL